MPRRPPYGGSRGTAGDDDHAALPLDLENDMNAATRRRWDLPVAIEVATIVAGYVLMLTGFGYQIANAAGYLT